MRCKNGTARQFSAITRTLGAVTCVAMLSLTCSSEPASAQQQSMQFRQLPSKVSSDVKRIRKLCKGFNRKFKPYNLMHGITVIDLEGDGSRDLLMDARRLCNDWMPGANCSKRGCDLTIWKQVRRRSWTKVFDEHLHRKFISLGGGQRFQLIVASVYAGSPQCKPGPDASHPSGENCDVLIRYRNGKWIWTKIK